MTQPSELRVLMIGPGRKLPSGITAVVNAILPGLEQRTQMSYLATVEQRDPLDCGQTSWSNVKIAVSQYARFLRELIRFRPQVIHIHTSQGIAWLKDSFFIVIGRLAGSRVVLHVHAADYDILHARQPAPVRAYTRAVFRLVSAVIAVSASWGERLSALAPRERIHVFLNCIDTRAYLPPEARSANGKANALFIGSVGLRKGAFDLIEAVGQAKARGAKLRTWIAGYEESPGEMDRAQTRVAELQIADMCTLTGKIGAEQKQELLDKAEMFVLPSYNEGLPMAILEALSSGLPVVSTPVGGIPEVIRPDENGYLVEPGDVNSLAEKLALLAGDAALRERMGRRSREIAVNELDASLYVERLCALYARLLA